jgi:hypothetical protein
VDVGVVMGVGDYGSEEDYGPLGDAQEEDAVVEAVWVVRGDSFDGASSMVISSLRRRFESGFGGKVEGRNEVVGRHWSRISESRSTHTSHSGRLYSGLRISFNSTSGINAGLFQRGR